MMQIPFNNSFSALIFDLKNIGKNAIANYGNFIIHYDSKVWVQFFFFTLTLTVYNL